MNHAFSSSREPIIEVRDLVVYYGERVILDGVSLEVLPGEIFAIIGRSGCGKSTLLRHLVGLERPASGCILIKGKDITSLTERELIELRKKMGVLFQSSALFGTMTVGENVALPLREHTELSESTINIMIRIKLNLVGLSGFEDFMPDQLSGGMKKRAALARAITMDPEILFFDEPSGGLDPIVAGGMDELILRLRDAFKMTIIVVTHELASVFKVADRVAMLDGGKILAVARKEELQGLPDSRVQQFLRREPDPEEVDPGSYLERLTAR